MRATVKFQLRQFYIGKEGQQSLALRNLVNRKSTYIGLGVSVYPKLGNNKTTTESCHIKKLFVSL